MKSSEVTLLQYLFILPVIHW